MSQFGLLGGCYTRAERSVLPWAPWGYKRRLKPAPRPQGAYNLGGAAELMDEAVK